MDEIPADLDCRQAQTSRKPLNMKRGRIDQNMESAGSPCFSTVKQFSK